MVWPVRTTTDIITTDSAGRTVEAVPVYATDVAVQNAVGRWVDPAPAEESDVGDPVRFVDAVVVQDSTGKWVDATPVSGVGATPVEVTAGYLLAGFTGAESWTESGAGETEAAAGHNGTAIKLTADAAADSQVTITRTGMSYSVWNQPAFVLYIDTPEPRRCDSLTIDLATDGTFAKYWRRTLAIKDQFAAGGQFVAFRITDFSANGGITNIEALTAARLTLTSSSGGGELTVDTFAMGRGTKGQVIIAFDDNWASVYGTAFPYMEAAGVPGTIYTIGNRVGEASYMTQAQLLECQAAGWDIAHHSFEHKGYNRDPRTVDINGDLDGVCQSQSPAATFTLNGDLVSGGTVTNDAPRLVTVRNAGDETGKSVTISGTYDGGAQAATVYLGAGGHSTTLVPFDTITGATISEAATGNIQIGVSHSYQEIYDSIEDNLDYLLANGFSRAARHIAYPFGERNVWTDEVCDLFGIKTGRNIIGDVVPISFGLYNDLRLNATVPIDSWTVNDVLVYVSMAELFGTTAIITFHRITTPEADELDFAVADFEDVIDYIAARVAAGAIEATTISSWHSRIPAKSTNMPPAPLAPPTIVNMIRGNELMSSTTYWTLTGGCTVALADVAPPTGVLSSDGSAPRCWLVTDPGGSFAQAAMASNPTIAADSATYTLTWYVQKDNDETRMPEFTFSVAGGTTRTYRGQLNTKTGAEGFRGNATAGMVTISSHDANWWKVTITAPNNGTNTNIQTWMNPAMTATLNGATAGTTGSVVVCAPQLEPGSGSAYHARY